MRVAIISDSHVPTREPVIPGWVLEHVRAADHTIHAGDFDSQAALATVREASRDLTAVYGNMDPDIDLPGTATLDVGGVRFVVTHGTASGPAAYQERVLSAVTAEAAADRPTVGVSGHTHEVMDEQFGQYRVLNPGSCTGADPAARATCMTAEVEGGELSVEVHEG